VAERLGPRRITIVGADESEYQRQLTEIEAAGGIAGALGERTISRGFPTDFPVEKRPPARSRAPPGS